MPRFPMNERGEHLALQYRWLNPRAACRMAHVLASRLNEQIVVWQDRDERTYRLAQEGEGPPNREVRWAPRYVIDTEGQIWQPPEFPNAR